MMRRSWLMGAQKPLSQMLPSAHSESTAQAWPAGVFPPHAGSANSKSATRESLISSGGHLPFAVLEHEVDLGGLHILAFRALHFQGRVVARDLGAFDLELHALDFLLHLGQLVAGLADVRRHHPLVHEGVAVDHL